MFRLCGLLLILHSQWLYQGLCSTTSTRNFSPYKQSRRRSIEARDRNVHWFWNELPETVVRTKRLKEEFVKRQMITPGYYEAECSDKKKCKEGKYCNLLYCEDCHREKIACTNKMQCCKGMECVYGRCEKKSKGDPGTFCEKDSECGDGCCVLEPTISSLLPICKPRLGEHHQCSSVLYRKVWIGEKPDCGPCQEGMECVQKGSYGNHEICMKPS